MNPEPIPTRDVRPGARVAPALATSMLLLTGSLAAFAAAVGPILCGIAGGSCRPGEEERGNTLLLVAVLLFVAGVVTTGVAARRAWIRRSGRVDRRTRGSK